MTDHLSLLPCARCDDRDTTILAVVAIGDDILARQNPAFVPSSAREFWNHVQTCIRREFPGVLPETPAMLKSE